jgi:hypothetical protein
METMQKVLCISNSPSHTYALYFVIHVVKKYYYTFSLQKTLFCANSKEHGRPKVTAVLGEPLD